MMMVNKMYEFEPEVEETVATMTTPPTRQLKKDIDILIKEIKNHHSLDLGVTSLSEIFRWLNIQALHDKQAATRNFANATNGSFTFNETTFPINFIQFQGMASKGLVGSGEENGLQFTQNLQLSAYNSYGAFGVYRITDDHTQGQSGSVQTNGEANMLVQRNVSSSSVRYNGTTSIGSGGADTIPAGSTGLYSVKRTGTTVENWFRDTMMNTGTSTSVGTRPTSGRIGINHREANNNTRSGFIIDYIAFSFYGSYDIDVAFLQQAFDDFLEKYN
jgi:hypothetical protein